MASVVPYIASGTSIALTIAPMCARRGPRARSTLQ